MALSIHTISGCGLWTKEVLLHVMFSPKLVVFWVGNNTRSLLCFVYYFAVYITIYETCKEAACLIGLYDDIWGYLFFSTVFYDNQKCYMSDSD